MVLAHLRNFHSEQRRQLFQFTGNVTKADRAMMRRAMRVPVVDEPPRADGKAVTAVGVADFK